MKSVKKVALLEDDRSMQGLLKTLLELEGFQVTVVPDRSGMAPVLNTLQNEQPDVLLLDVNLFNMDGINILRQLRTTADTRDIYVVMSSGMDLRDQCLLAGANDFLLKPFMPDELIQKIYEGVQ